MSAPPRGTLLPHYVFRDFLDPALHRALLDWTIASAERFEPATLAGGKFDPTRRVAERLRDLGEMRAPLEARLRAAADDIFARTGTRPFPLASMELELAAHGDGAHFTRHLDIPVGPGRKPLGGTAAGEDRIVSAVYYFHKEPKSFSGGALRLHSFTPTHAEGRHVDLEPAQNSLVVFPSWLPHEVTKVSCPSRAFADYRFAVNCWFCRKLA
jgi:SM-20-related protein